MAKQSRGTKNLPNVGFLDWIIDKVLIPYQEKNKCSAQETSKEKTKNEAL